MKNKEIKIDEQKLRTLLDKFFYLGLNNCWEVRYKEIMEEEIKKLRK